MENGGNKLEVNDEPLYWNASKCNKMIDTKYDTTYNISRRFPYVKMGKAVGADMHAVQGYAF